MSISSSTNKVIYNCNGSQTTFPITFDVILDSNGDAKYIKVIHTDADGNETVLTKGTDYTVSGLNVVTTATYATGTKITIARDMDYLQETDLRDNEPFPAQTLETMIDKVTMEVQQVSEMVDRTVRIPISDDTASLTLPTKEARRTTYLYFNEDGDIEAQPGAPPRFWSQYATYSTNDITQYQGYLWKSLQNNNKGNDPTTSSSWWAKLSTSDQWDERVVYSQNDITSYQGTLVKSKVNNNQGHTPNISPGATDAYWEVVETGGGVETEGELGEDADQNDALYFSTDGKLYKGDKRDLSKCFIAGLAVVSGNAGDTIKIAKAGRLSGFSGLTAGTQYYLGNDGDLVTSGDIDYFDYKVPLGVAVSATELEVRVGNPEYRANTDDGLPIGHIVYSINPSAPAGYLPFAYNNAVSIAQYPVLYSVVGKKFEKMHTDAGDPSTDSDHFYPTPIPGYFPRPAIPDTEEIDSTSDINTSSDTITLSADDYNTLRRSRDATATNPHGVPVLLRLESGSLPAGLSEDTVYYVRFTDDSNHYIKLYTTEENAINDTSAVNITGTATGKFKLTQAGIYQRDAFQGHWHTVAREDINNYVPNARSDAATTGGSNGVVYSTPTNYDFIAQNSITDGSHGTPRTSNETRPNEVFLYGYIKAEYITPAGEPVSALRYDTGWTDFWTTNIRGSSVDITHNLNSESSELIYTLSIKNKTTGDILTPIIVTRAWDQATSSDANYIYGAELIHMSNNIIRLRIGTYGLIILKADGHEQQITTNGADFQYRLIILKPALLATYTDAPIRAKYEITDSNDVTVSLPDANGQTAERTYWRTGSGSGKVKFTTYGSQTINGDSASIWYLEGEGVIKLAPVDGNWEVVEFNDEKITADYSWEKKINGEMVQTGWDYIEGNDTTYVMNTTTLNKTFYDANYALTATCLGYTSAVPTVRYGAGNSIQFLASARILNNHQMQILIGGLTGANGTSYNVNSGNYYIYSFIAIGRWK